MSTKEMWENAMVEAFRETSLRLALFLPKLLAFLSFLVLGVLAGWLVKALLLRLMSALRFDAFCERLGLMPALVRAGVVQPASALIGRLSFWAVFLLFTLMGIDALNLPATANLMSILVGFLPNVLTSAVVLLFGILLGNFLSEAALIATVNAQIQEARIIARLVRWSVWLFTGAMVLTELGIAKEIVVAAFCIIFGGTVLALAIAVGLGGRHIAREKLERRIRRTRREEDELTHI
ncbi:MAG TPA: hypothetical protein VJ746_00050 [Nitrospira sp.]|nr:hypothetical protein [Nitrospira sp.]